MSAQEENDYVSAEEAALILGVKVSTVYAYASRGRIRSYRQGIKRSRLYRRSELLPLVEIAPSPSIPDRQARGGYAVAAVCAYCDSPNPRGTGLRLVMRSREARRRAYA